MLGGIHLNLWALVSVGTLRTVQGRTVPLSGFAFAFLQHCRLTYTSTQLSRADDADGCQKARRSVLESDTQHTLGLAHAHLSLIEEHAHTSSALWQGERRSDCVELADPAVSTDLETRFTAHGQRARCAGSLCKSEAKSVAERTSLSLSGQERDVRFRGSTPTATRSAFGAWETRVIAAACTVYARTQALCKEAQREWVNVRVNRLADVIVPASKRQRPHWTIYLWWPPLQREVWAAAAVVRPSF
jgi:hypothetical protein